MHFYQSRPPLTLIILYKSLVRPILEYIVPGILWDPTSPPAITLNYTVQHFALKIASNA